jgi:outer membrane receptor protein involved in Fe transport
MLYGQRTTATIFGSVQDPSGAAVPGAKVIVTNEDTNAQYAAQSDSLGEFTVTFLPVGRYRIAVEAQGFKTAVQSGLALEAGQQFRYPVALEVGTLTEKVVVSAEPPLVQNATAAQMDNISRLQLSELPQGRRDFTILLGLQTGFRPGRQGLFQFNGLATGGSSVTVDGVDGAGDTETPSTSMFQDFNFIKVVSQEAIQEVSVSKGVISADVARTFSANINVITKSGSNEFHGSLFELWQNDILNARHAMLAPTAPKPPVRFHQFGGSLGGPILKDRLFFFFTYEGYRLSSFRILNAQVPTASFKEQATRAVPAYQPLLDLFPLPTDPIGTRTDVGLWRGASSNTASDNHAVARVDYTINDSSRLAARYIRGRPQQRDPRTYPFNPRVYLGVTESGNVTYTRLAPSWTSETRFGFNLNDSNRTDGVYANGMIPTVDVQGLFSTDGGGTIVRGHSYSIEEVISKTIGRHSVKFGGLYMGRAPGRLDEEVPVLRYGNANAFIANTPNRVRVTFGQPSYHGRHWNLGFFVQDDFRFSPRLILNLGVRYEYFSVFTERDGLLFNPDGVYAAALRPTTFRAADSIYNADKNNFQPRLGFAWSLDRTSRTVIRGGAGITVAPPNLRNFSGLVYRSPQIPFRFDFTGPDITNLGLRYPVTNDGVAQIIATRDVPKGYAVFDPNNRDPYSVQWSFDIQRQISPTMVFQTGYVGNKGLKVIASHTYNLPDRITGIRPFPNSLESGWRNASDFSYYHGWQNSLRKRLSNNLAFNINYTWSKAMAIHAGDFWAGNDVRVQDEDNWLADKGPARYDVAHRFVVDYVYEAPFEKWFKAQGLARHFAGGWQVSGIFTAETGDAINIEQASNRTFSRPDYIGGDPYSEGDRFQWLNLAAFQRVPQSSASGQPIRPGTVGKNSLRAPGSWDISMSIAKNLAFRERYRLQLRVDAFNAFNHVNLGGPITDITRPTFGRILSVGGARSLQLHGRFTF